MQERTCFVGTREAPRKPGGASGKALPSRDSHPSKLRAAGWAAACATPHPLFHRACDSRPHHPLQEKNKKWSSEGAAGAGSRRHLGGREVEGGGGGGGEPTRHSPHSTGGPCASAAKKARRGVGQCSPPFFLISRAGFHQVTYQPPARGEQDSTKLLLPALSSSLFFTAVLLKEFSQSPVPRVRVRRRGCVRTKPARRASQRASGDTVPCVTA